MKRPVFKRWIRRECLKISGNSSFNLRKLAAQAQRSSEADTACAGELRASIELYALANGQEEQLSAALWETDAIGELSMVRDIISGRSLEHLALRGTPLRSLPAEHRAIMMRFYDDYHAIERIAEQKRELCRECQELLKRTGSTYAPLSEATGIAAPNISSYLRNGAVEKVTLEGATALRDCLLRIAEEPLTPLAQEP